MELNGQFDEAVDNYGEIVRGFSVTYPAEVWFIIYNADIRMRSERM